MQKQIEEVMALVDCYVKASIEYDIHLDDVPLYDESMDLAREQIDKKRSAIEAKLRELLPAWRPIESAERPEIGANGFGERVLLCVDCGDGTLKSTKIGWWCDRWMQDTGGSVKENGYRAVAWMPLPKAQE